MMSEIELNETYPVTEGERNFFRINGFVVMRGVLSCGLVDELRRELDALVKSKWDSQRRDKSLEFVEAFDTRNYSRAVQTLTSSKRVAHLVCELMGCDGVRRYEERLLYKGSGFRATPFHTDCHYVPLEPCSVCSIWIPLVDTTASMGALCYVPESFKYEELLQFNISPEGNEAVLRLCRERGLKVWSYDFAKGDIGVHNGGTVHGTEANTSSEARKALVMMQIDKEARLIRKPQTKFQRRGWLRSGLRPGEIFDTPRSPVVYSK